MMVWALAAGVRGDIRDILGYLPDIFIDGDPRPAAEQANERYLGGWHPQDGWSLKSENGVLVARYPGDPPLRPLAITQLNDEVLLLYPHAYVCVMQPDGSCQMARMD